MGTQQILIIVLTVIIIGIAVAVGILMFDTQSNNSIRNAISLDLLNLSVQAQAWFRTPSTMNGGGYSLNASDMNKLVYYLDVESDIPSATVFGPNATFIVTLGSEANEIVISGTSTVKKSIVGVATIDLTADKNTDGFDRGIKIRFD